MGYTISQVLQGRNDVFISDDIEIAVGNILYRPDTIYLVGTGTTGATDAAIDITSIVDFTTKIGVSPSLTHVQNYFASAPTNGLYLKFVRVEPSIPALVIGDVTAALAIIDAGEPGIIIAPEFFDDATLDITLQTAIAQAMGTTAETIGGLALIDTPYSVRNIVGTSTTGIRGFAADLNTSNFCAVYFPRSKYLGKTVFEASSPALVSAFSRRWAGGIQQPPAGVSCPLAITELEYNVTPAERDTIKGLNPIIRRKVRGAYSFYVWGADVASGMAINTRLILSSLIRTVEERMTEFLFSSIDDKGNLLSTIGEATREIFFSAWQAGYLQGATPSDAFSVKCDRENNLTENLDKGLIVVEVNAHLAGTVKFILVSIKKLLESDVAV